jgi:hypothetical protein
MFSTLDNDLRTRVMNSIKKVIPVMESEIKEIGSPDASMISSVENLKFVLAALEQSHAEFAELFEKSHV